MAFLIKADVVAAPNSPFDVALSAPPTAAVSGATVTEAAAIEGTS
jgi:hypothetical protein